MLSSAHWCGSLGLNEDIVSIVMVNMLSIPNREGRSGEAFYHPHQNWVNSHFLHLLWIYTSFQMSGCFP